MIVFYFLRRIHLVYGGAMDILDVLLKIESQGVSVDADEYIDTLQKRIGGIRNTSLFLEGEEREIASLVKRIVLVHYIDEAQVKEIKKICLEIILRDIELVSSEDVCAFLLKELESGEEKTRKKIFEALKKEARSIFLVSL
jgi:hypothetical protein